jgi:serine/threonine protein phosphatase PrpC
MEEAKKSARAIVRIGYDGSVHKFFRADKARERFENELRVLRYLDRKGCDFVPRVLGFDRDKLELITSNCGARVQQMTSEKLHSLFAELERYGVRHDDPFLRNITYRASDGRFCIIDFEFATILDAADSSAEGSDQERGYDRDPMSVARSIARVRWSGRTDRGRFRANNEDAFLAVAFSDRDFYFLGADGEAAAAEMDFLFAVSDGMGGERSGEFASRFALDNVTRILPRRFQLSPAHRRLGISDCIAELFQATHRQLTSLGRSFSQGYNMGATLSLVWIVGDWVHWGHIGDSRIYHFTPQQGLRQISEDHTHVGWLRRNGQLNEREARFHPRKNVLSQSLGSGNLFVRPQTESFRCQAGERLLLCTDGVVDGLWDRAIEDLVMSPPPAEQQRPPSARLVDAAVQESGRDNTTALLVEFLAE